MKTSFEIPPWDKYHGQQARSKNVTQHADLNVQRVDQKVPLWDKKRFANVSKRINYKALPDS